MMYKDIEWWYFKLSWGAWIVTVITPNGSSCAHGIDYQRRD